MYHLYIMVILLYCVQICDLIQNRNIYPYETRGKENL